MREHESLAAFLGLFFEGLVPPGLIEVRLIHEKGTDSDYTKVHWFDSTEKLVAGLADLNAEAEQHQAAVFFGVLPRPRVGAGRKRDLTHGRVVWADLDFGDYEGGEAEARALLDAFPIPPSAIVRSGHGLHAYWSLDAAVTAQSCSALAKRVELALRSDHVSDAPRIMRLPFSINRKHGEATLVELERLHPEDECDPSDLETCTPEPDAQRATQTPAAPPGVTRAAPPVEVRLPEAVGALLRESRSLAELYVGRGKQAGDQSTSGYDMSFAVACVKPSRRGRTRGLTQRGPTTSAIRSPRRSRAAPPIPPGRRRQDRCSGPVSRPVSRRCSRWTSMWSGW